MELRDVNETIVLGIGVLQGGSSLCPQPHHAVLLELSGIMGSQMLVLTGDFACGLCVAPPICTNISIPAEGNSGNQPLLSVLFIWTTSLPQT